MFGELREKTIYFSCRNLQIFIDFPAMANADDGDHDFFGVLMEYHAVATHPQPEIIVFSLQQLKVPGHGLEISRQLFDFLFDQQLVGLVYLGQFLCGSLFVKNGVSHRPSSL